MATFRSAAASTLLVAGLAFTASADTAQLVSVQDNTLYQTADGSLSNGSGSSMFVGRNNAGSNSIRRGLVQFDLSAIPADAVITAASLRMNLTQASGAASAVTLNRVLSGWGEGASNAGSPGGGGAASQPNDATWLHTFYSSSLWTNAGGDFAPVSSASISVGAIGQYSWSSVDLLADVQAWRSTPTDNHGWIMLGVESAAGTAKRFDTREAALADNRPTLFVEYTVPAPASGALALLGLGAAMRRRRA